MNLQEPRKVGELDDQELRRRYYERLCDWSEPGEVKINREGRLLGPLIVLDRAEMWKRIHPIPWGRPER